jgi:pimeloyl-ACP methyl ester carboxylesterase
VWVFKKTHRKEANLPGLLDHQITLKDGRKLGYAECGNPQGKPVFYFHGTPGSRIECNIFPEAANSIGARIIVADRPGFGLSDFQKGRRILDLPNDIAELADNLGIDRFAILGLSGGGPYAAACAFKIPERLTAVAMVSSAYPYDPKAKDNLSGPQHQGVFTDLIAFGQLKTSYNKLIRNLHLDPEAVAHQMYGSSDKDKELLARPEVIHLLGANLQQAFLSGPRGGALDWLIVTRPWGFRLDGISVGVQLWQGKFDIVIPSNKGRDMASRIPNCRVNFLEEGHISLLFNHTQEILSDLIN